MTGNRQQHGVIRVARHCRGTPPSQRCRNAFAVALVAAALVGGCVSPRDGEMAGELVCNSAQHCRVKVQVTCAPACRAAVDHPRVFARGNDIVGVVENKPGQSYVFRTGRGIAFKAEPGKNGFRCHVEANGNRYACMNRRTPGTHEYGIQLDCSPAVPLLDPWIENN